MRSRGGWAVAAVVACALLVGCTTGSGVVVTEAREAVGFSAIDLQGAGRVEVAVTGTESIEITAEDNILPRLTSEVRDGRLVLGTRGSIRPTEDIVYTITAADLDGLSVSGSGGIEVDGIEAETLDLDVSGSGAITAAGTSAGRVDVDISGSGAVLVTGVADALDLSLSGSGSFEGSDLEVAAGAVSLSGSGNAVVNASRTLDVSVSGSGNVVYLGEPSTTVSTTGSGSISRG